MQRAGGSGGGTGLAEPAESLERHRAELTAYCYRMLGSSFEAEDAVQETLTRAWRAFDRFERRSALRTWLYRIASNVCLDMLGASQRRARPMDLSAPGSAEVFTLVALPESTWVEPVPTGRVLPSLGDPGDLAQARESLRLAFVAVLQHLPPRQRARATLADHDMDDAAPARPDDAAQRALLDRYVDAFQRYDMDALAALIHEDATQSMPPFDLWLRGRDDIFAWWVGPGHECRGSILVPAPANGMPAWGQYKPAPGGGHLPWSIHLVQLERGRIADLTFFLDTARLFPLFGLPPSLPA